MKLNVRGDNYYARVGNLRSWYLSNDWIYDCKQSIFLKPEAYKSALIGELLR